MNDPMDVREGLVMMRAFQARGCRHLSRAVVLLELVMAGESRTMGQLARACACAPASMTAMINAMEREGLVQTVSEGWVRERWIEVAPLGEDLVRAVYEEMAKAGGAA